MSQSRTIFPTLIGNEKLKSILSADLATGKAAHAYILEGPKGSGKHTAARLICASAVCEHRSDNGYPLPCGACPSCRKILSGVSVDVMTLSNGDKATIGVDAVRALRDTLYVTPNDGDRKFYLIENAHLLTVAAQNALLKSLEEPPEFVMFLLLCENTSLLLETIKSRAPTVKTEVFSPDFTEDYLMKNAKKPNHEKAVRAAHLSGGALGMASELYNGSEKELKKYGIAEDFVRLLLSARKSDTLAALPSFPKERAACAEILSLAELALRDAVSAKKGGNLLFYSKADGVPDFTKKISVKRLIELIYALKGAEGDIAANCSINTVLTSLIMNCQKGLGSL